MKFIKQKGAELSTQEIMELVDSFANTEEVRRTRLFNYYIAQNDIKQRVMGDPLKPNNKPASAFASYISNTMTGYFMGTPVAYSSEDENALEKIQETFDYNDEQSVNAQLAKDASIYGIAYELHYVDRDGYTRFKRVDPTTAFTINDSTLDEDILYFIRYYYINEGSPNNPLLTRYIEVVDRYNSTTYKQDGIGMEITAATLTQVEQRAHGYQLVPVAVYKNNREELGDYELVLDQIDSYDKIQANALNDQEQFSDSYLALKGMEGTDSEDVRAMRENRVMLLPSDGDAAWLVKSGGTESYAQLQADTERHIYEFTGCPNMSDESFAGNQSGVALKYKLLPLENKTSEKEREFKVGLQRRIELVGYMLNVLNGDFSYLTINMTFRRTLPVDLLAEAQTVNSLWGIVSDETALAQLSFIEDPAAELEKKEQQSDKALDFGGHDEEQFLLERKASEDGAEISVDSEPIS